MTQTIDAAAFQQMVIHAAAAISAQKQHINDLNVFPVPDGDTGTNMSLTISAAAAELKKKQKKRFRKHQRLRQASLRHRMRQKIP